MVMLLAFLAQSAIPVLMAPVQEEEDEEGQGTNAAPAVQRGIYLIVLISRNALTYRF